MIDKRHRLFFSHRKRNVLLNLSLTILLLSCLVFTPFSVSATQNEPTNFAKGKDYEVKVEIVQPQRTAQGKLIYRLHYRYEFERQKTITVKGIGTFPAKGELEHFIEGQHLEFLDKADHLLAKVMLKPNTTPPEGGAADFPQENEFSGFQSDQTRNPMAFLPKAFQILNQSFPNGYNIQQDKQVTSLITAYRDLSSQRTDNVCLQTAIRLAYPFDPNGEQFYFRIYIVSRQHPCKSDDWEKPDSVTQEIVNEIVKKLLNDLKN
jgi:hypothetical protein